MKKQMKKKHKIVLLLVLSIIVLLLTAGAPNTLITAQTAENKYYEYFNYYHGYSNYIHNYKESFSYSTEYVLDNYNPAYKNDIKPMSTATIQYRRIRYSGRDNANSIVIVLLGDAFTVNRFGTWNYINPNPERGTLLYHANNAINAMMATYPFNLFSHLFTVYVINAVALGQIYGINGYLGTVTATGTLAPDPRNYRIRQLAETRVVNSTHLDIFKLYQMQHL